MARAAETCSTSAEPEYAPDAPESQPMPNHFAYVALFSWPVVVFFLFRTRPRSEALIWSILGGYLLLPYDVGIKIKMIPTLDKTLIPALSAAVMCLITVERPAVPRRGAPRPAQQAATDVRSEGNAREDSRAVGSVAHNTYSRQRASHPMPSTTEAQAKAAVLAQGRSRGAWPLNFLLALLFITPFVTALTNADPVQAGPYTLPGLHLYDALSMISGTLVSILPFLLGRRYLARPEEQVLLLRLLCISGLLYSLPTLFEVRMSPQLSRWVYGFLAQPFAMAMRDGGFRPVIFLQQGLWLAIFLAMTVFAGFALWRHERAQGRRTRWLLAGLYLSVVLVLCHSLGALMILIALAPVALLFSVRQQLVIATIVALSILTYPMLRGAGLVPVDTIYSFVKSSISAERAQSFYFRLANEDQLLARADKKPLAGWGGWGRERLYDANGDDLSVTDGIWIIVIGVSGWLGYLATFGLFTAPILLLALRQRYLDLQLATSGLCLVLAANLSDMIPNATLTPVTWLVAGALAGRATRLTLPEVVREKQPARSQRQGALARPRRSPSGAAYPRSAGR